MEIDQKILLPPPHPTPPTNGGLVSTRQKNTVQNGLSRLHNGHILTHQPNHFSKLSVAGNEYVVSPPIPGLTNGGSVPPGHSTSGRVSPTRRGSPHNVSNSWGSYRLVARGVEKDTTMTSSIKTNSDGLSSSSESSCSSVDSDGLEECLTHPHPPHNGHHACPQCTRCFRDKKACQQHRDRCIA